MSRGRDSARAEALRSRVLVAVARTVSSPRAEQTRRTVSSVVGGLLAAVAALMATGGVMLGTRPVGFVLGTSVGWAILAIVGVRAALARSRSMLGLPTGVLVSMAVALGPLLFAWFAVLHHALAGADEIAPVHAHVACFALTALYAAGPLAGVALAYRGVDPVHPRATGALAWAAGGALGGALIDLHCRIGESGHVAVAHVLPVALLALMGALAGPRVFGVTTGE